MSGFQPCLYFSLIILCFHVANGKPFFFGNAFWCDFICDDDDVSTTTVSSEDYDWMCTGCGPRRTTTVRPPVAIPAMPAMSMGPQPLSLNIPNGNPVSVSMSPNGWVFNFGSGQPAPAAASPPAAAPAAAPGGAAPPAAAPPAAGATPAPAGATTAAPGATTAAAGATTAATTAAPAG